MVGDSAVLYLSYHDCYLEGFRSLVNLSEPRRSWERACPEAYVIFPSNKGLLPVNQLSSTEHLLAIMLEIVASHSDGMPKYNAV
jgi:hypothetical protein